MSRILFVSFGLLAAATAGCASSPAAPFNQMEKSNVLAFRLQNYEPPAAPAGAAAPAGQQLIPGIPTEIQQWIAQGAQGLQQLIPPGLLPPNLLQGAAPAAAPVVENVPRFYGFRILGQTQVADSELRQKLGELFGDADAFDTPKSTSFYPEMGVAFGPSPGAPTYDFLVSFSCNRVEAKNFAWPHAQKTGMTADTVKELTGLVQKIWPNG